MGPGVRFSKYIYIFRLFFGHSAARCNTINCLSLMYGERDNTFVPEMMGVRTNVQLGDNTNLIDVVSVKAHFLAATVLLNPDLTKSKVDGETFNITDGSPVPF